MIDRTLERADRRLVWILQTGEPLECDADARPMRATSLANALVSDGCDVVIWTSRFFHQKKMHRNLECLHPMRQGVTTKFIESPGYTSNIGLGRLWDHLVLAKNLSHLLSSVAQQDFPDFIFIGYPPIETANVMASWARKRNIPCLIDVKDQWPEIFVLNAKGIFKHFARVVLCPYFFLGRRALRQASGICSMSYPFLEWASRFAGRSVCSNDIVIPLTPFPFEIDSKKRDAVRNWQKQFDAKFWSRKFILFVGSFSRAFDFQTVIKAAEYFEKKDLDVAFIFCGDGELRDYLVARSRGLENMFVLDWVGPAQIMALSKNAVASVAPYLDSQDFRMSIPNKVIDSLMLGLPIISSLGGEVKKLIDEEQIGFFYETSEELSEAIFKVLDGEASYMRSNARELYETQFDYYLVYRRLRGHIMKLLASA